MQPFKRQPFDDTSQKFHRRIEEKYEGFFNTVSMRKQLSLSQSQKKLTVVVTCSLYFYLVFTALLCNVLHPARNFAEHGSEVRQRKERKTVCGVKLELIARLASGRQQSESVNGEDVILLMKLP